MSRVKLNQQQIASHTTQRPSTILVTGCTSGIGKSLVIEFARLGYNIIGCGRRIKNLREVEAASSAATVPRTLVNSVAPAF